MERDARPVRNHPIQAVWRTLGEQVYKFLDSRQVKWTTIDPVRFAEVDKEAGPLHLWIGVERKTLSFEDAKEAANGCKQILTEAQFPDVEIAFRESTFIRFSGATGPKLLNQPEHSYFDPVADVRSPFTPALAIQIAPRDTPHIDGAGALYLREGGQSNRVFLLTARHVVLPLNTQPNEFYEKRPRQSRQEVLILGSKTYSSAIEAIMAKISSGIDNVGYHKEQLARLEKSDESEGDVARERMRCEYKLEDAEEIVTAGDKLQ